MIVYSAKKHTDNLGFVGVFGIYETNTEDKNSKAFPSGEGAELARRMRRTLLYLKKGKRLVACKKITLPLYTFK